MKSSLDADRFIERRNRDASTLSTAGMKLQLHAPILGSDQGDLMDAGSGRATLRCRPFRSGSHDVKLCPHWLIFRLLGPNIL